MKTPYIPRKNAPVSPYVARITAQGLNLSEKTQDWLSGGYANHSWDDSIRNELLFVFPILPLTRLYQYMKKVRLLMNNVLSHADFTGNQKLREEVGHTWEMLQEEVDELAMRIYISTFQFDPSNTFKGTLRTLSILQKLRVLLPEETDNLSKMSDSIQNYFESVHPTKD